MADRGARVELSGWGWRHAGRRNPAVSDLNLVIQPGERVLLVGESGSGKSTTLAGIAGLLGSDEGDETGWIRVDGASPRDQRGRVGMVLQDPDSQLVLSAVGDDAAFGCENLGVPRDEIWRRVRASLEEVGLGHIPLDHPSGQLSGGQKQRLALAGVLAMRPGLLILDEPTANLDPSGVREVRDAVERVVERTGATLIVVEHRTTVWSDLVTRVVALKSGGGLILDDTTTRAFSEHQRALESAGLWVPQSVSPVTPSPANAPGSVALELVDLAVGRKSSNGGIVQSDITRTVRFGEAVVIVGENGAGKSTLALTVAGLLPELAGEVRASRELRGSAKVRPFTWKSKQLLTRIGTVFQDPEHQFVASTVRQELAVGLQALGTRPNEVTTRVNELLDRLRLGSLAEANPFTLSGGQKRRLSVATLMATSPKVLVLDEPTFGQDRRSWADLVELLLELRADGGTLISVTHDAEYQAALGDDVWTLEPRALGAAA